MSANTKKQLNPTEKAAILLISLGEELSAELLRQLPQSDAQRILSAAARMGRVDESTVSIVLSEFQTLLTSLKNPLLGGPDAAQKLLKSALAGHAIGSQLGQFAKGAPQSFRDAEHIAGKDLFKIIAGEHPQTVAVILAHLSPKHAGGVLHNFAEAQRTDILLRLAHMQQVDEDALQEIYEFLTRAIERYRQQSVRQIGGMDRTAAILAAMGSSERESLLQNLAERSAQTAETIRSQLFTFEDIARFDNSEIEKILRKVPGTDLELALRRASETLKQRFFASMSERKSEQIKDNIATAKPVPKTKVDEAQFKIVQIVTQMLAAGELRDPSEEVV